MDTYYIRHDFDVSDTALEYLRKEKRIAIHFPWDRFAGDFKSDSRSTRPGDYKDKGAIRALNALLRLGSEGGVVFSTFRDSQMILVGKVEPGQKIQLDSRFKWRTKFNRTAILKTLQLNEAKLIPIADVQAIPVRPARGTMSRWLKCGDYVEKLLSNKQPPIMVSVPDYIDTIENQLLAVDVFVPDSDVDARERIAASLVRRRGQPQFRNLLIQAYGGKCAITGCNETDVLEAAHILPYRGPYTNKVQNGLLLRADLHVLFDLGRISIDPNTWTISIDQGLRNGYYGSFHGKTLNLPKIKTAWPNSEALVARQPKKKS